MGWRTQEAYEQAERERRKALPWRERYDRYFFMAWAMIAIAVACLVYACIR